MLIRALLLMVLLAGAVSARAQSVPDASAWARPDTGAAPSADAPPAAPGDTAAADAGGDADQQGRLNKPYKVFVGADVHAVPSDDAPTIARLWPNVEVLVTQVVAEGEWIQVRLPDGQTTGYVPSDAIPAAFGQTTQDLPSTVSGAPIVRDTATLVIGARNVHLFKLEGTDGPLADQMQQFISAAGGTVSCAEQSLGYYRCRVADGTDIALVALVNGAALSADGAPDTYVQQQGVAQKAHRGIWGTTAVPPPG